MLSVSCKPAENFVAEMWHLLFAMWLQFKSVLSLQVHFSSSVGFIPNTQAVRAYLTSKLFHSDLISFFL